MTVNRKQANLKMLSEADEIQDKTRESIFRIQRQAAEAEQVGSSTLEELKRQGQQMSEISEQMDGNSARLDQTQRQQDKVDSWAGNWFGWKQRAAAEKNDEELAKVKEVYENEKFDRFTRKWKPAGMVLVTNPTMEAPQIFDPAVTIAEASASWSVDFSMLRIDANGWTYASDFSVLNAKGVGDENSKWNSYVRRRKWKYQERRSRAQSEGSAGTFVRQEERNASRKKEVAAAGGEGGAPNGGGTRSGYVPRERVQLVNQGSSRQLSADDVQAASPPKRVPDGMLRLKKKDAVIDSGLDQISGQLDSLNRIAASMNEEVQSQVAKTERIGSSMQQTSEKQGVVNARQKKLLATS